MRDLARIVTLAPLAAAAIALEDRCARWWPLRFPRAIADLERQPEWLVELLTVPSHGLLAPIALPPGASLVALRRGGLLANEPDKNRTTALLDLEFTSPAGGLHVVRVAVKLQSGRGMPLYIQAIRAVMEPGFSREIEFYRRLAPVVPVRVARPLFADAITAINRVCLVVEYVECTTVADWRGCPLPAMRAMLAEAAKLNAGFLGRLGEPAAAWIPAREGLDFMSFVTGFIGRAEPWYRDIWAGLQRYFANRPVTLVHGDCRPGNMLFTGDVPVLADPSLTEHDAAAWPDSPAAPGVVMSDWEAVNGAPLLWDFTYAIVIGLRAGDRRAWLDRLLGEFLAALEREGVSRSHLDPERCRLDVDLLAMVLAYMSFVILDNHLWDGQGNTIDDMRAWVTRVIEAATGIDAGAIGRALGVDPAPVRALQEHWRDRLKDVLDQYDVRRLTV